VGVKKHDSSKSDNSSLILRSVCTQPRQQSTPAPSSHTASTRLAASAACTSSLCRHGFLSRRSFAGLQPRSINAIHTPITDLSLGVNGITLAATHRLTARLVQFARDCDPRSISQALHFLLRFALNYLHRIINEIDLLFVHQIYRLATSALCWDLPSSTIRKA
jgi:hypothetical protein